MSREHCPSSRRTHRVHVCAVVYCSGHNAGRGGGDVRRWESHASEKVIVCHATTAVLHVGFTLLCGVAGGHALCTGNTRRQSGRGGDAFKRFAQDLHDTRWYIITPITRIIRIHTSCQESLWTRQLYSKDEKRHRFRFFIFSMKSPPTGGRTSGRT
jgi:hypothetical protein